MKLFTPDNTMGYTPEQLDALNQEWEQRLLDMQLESGTDEYYEAARLFREEVSRREIAQKQ